MSTEWRVGERIRGRWLVHGVKRGGMGIVYAVYDPEVRQAFAVKTLGGRPRRDTLRRFRDEADLWIRLAPHPNVTEARFVEIVDERPLLFLEYVSGGHLGRWIGTPRLAEDPPRVLRFAIELCDAMIHARRQGIAAHRDLKPHNCLVSADGRLKLTDFGLARVAAARGDTKRRGGTFEYMAPEQWTDFDGADERADVYSFGVLLFEMSTGRLPFGGRPDVGAKELERRHRSAPVPPADGGLDDVIVRCLAKSPADRFPSFVELRSRLDRAHVELTGAPVPPAPEGLALDARQWNARGASLRELGHFDDALACYERALALDPTLGHGWSNAAEVVFRLGDAARALTYFDRIPQGAADAHVHANRGGIALHLGDVAGALAASDLAIEQNPRLALAWNNRGASLAALGRWPEAIAAYERARTLDPALDLAWLNEGVALGTVGRSDEELDRYDQAIRVNRRSAPAWCNRGTVLAARGEWNEALRCYGRALRIERGYADAWFNLGDTLRAMGAWRRAHAAYARFTRLRPQDVEGWEKRAEAATRLGKKRDAASCRERAALLGSRPLGGVDMTQ